MTKKEREERAKRTADKLRQAEREMAIAKERAKATKWKQKQRREKK